MNFHRYILLGCGIFCSVLLRAQALEKIFIHTDKQVYVTGETIWMSIYCLNAQQNTPSSISVIAYVELLDKSANPLFQTRIRLKDGRGNGQIFIDPDIPSAVYYLRAYTSWMRNNTPVPFFEMPLFIVNVVIPPKEVQSADQTTGNSLNKHDRKAEIFVPRQIYDRREAVNLELHGLEEPASLSVSVYKIQPDLGLDLSGYIWGDEEVKINWEQKSADFSLLSIYPPEMKAPIIRGQIRGKIPRYLNLSFAGKAPDLYTVPVQADGQFQLEVSPSLIQEEMIFWVNGAAFTEDQIIIQSPFASQEILQPVDGFLSDKWHDFIESNIRNSQISHLYASYSFPRGKEEDEQAPVPFYGNAGISYVLDAYTRFPSLEEVFLEYVNKAQNRRINQKRYIHVWDEYQNIFSTSTFLVFDTAALTLIDGIPVLDPDFIWDFDVLKINGIDIVPKRYFSGDQAHAGIIHFITYEGDFGGNNLPGNLIVRSHTPMQKRRNFYAPDYSKVGLRSNRIPDFRNTLYWNPVWEYRDRSQRLTFYTGDDTGWYRIEVKGFTESGEKIHLTMPFEVKTISDN